MKHMAWKSLSMASSEECFRQYCITRDISCPDEFRELREQITSLFNETLSEINISSSQIGEGNNSYKTDYIFGLKLYKLFTDTYKMDVRMAADSGIWRFISLMVVPDIVEMRYGTNHPDRFWKKPKRIWLRVLWWYIYLSWQGTTEKTAEILRDNSTDEILQLVDRCGRGGYRVELYREIMRRYSLLDVQKRRRAQVFRKTMVMNTARVQVVEPGLSENGFTGYVDSLYSYFGW